MVSHEMNRNLRSVLLEFFVKALPQMSQTSIEHLLTQEAMIKWNKCFTSPLVEVAKSYENVETVGDGVLGLFAQTALFRKFPDITPSELTNALSYYVRNQYLKTLMDNRGKVGDVTLLSLMQVGEIIGFSNYKLDAIISADLMEALFGTLHIVCDISKYKPFASGIGEQLFDYFFEGIELRRDVGNSITLLEQIFSWYNKAGTVASPPRFESEVVQAEDGSQVVKGRFILSRPRLDKNAKVPAILSILIGLNYTSASTVALVRESYVAADEFAPEDNKYVYADNAELAKEAAASEALDYLAAYGITPSTVKKDKMSNILPLVRTAHAQQFRDKLLKDGYDDFNIVRLDKRKFGGERRRVVQFRGVDSSGMEHIIFNLAVNSGQSEDANKKVIETYLAMK